MSGRKILTILIIAAVLLIGILKWIERADKNEINIPDVNWQEVRESEEDGGSQEDLNNVSPSWREHNSAEIGVSLKIPQEANTFIERGRFKVRFLGPNSKQGTEITDGWTFYVEVEDLEGRNLDTKVREDFEEKKDKYKVLEEIERIEVEGSKSAYKFSFENALGNAVDAVFIPAEGSKIFSITYSVIANEKKKDDYKDMIERMIKTLELLDGENN